MTRTATTKLGAYTALAGLGLLGSLIVGRPELVALAAPFAVVLLAGLSLAETPEVKVAFELEHERQVEGEPVTGELELQSRTSTAFEFLLDLPRGLVAETPNPQVLRLRPDERRELDCTLRCEHWGGYAVGDFLLRSRDDCRCPRFPAAKVPEDILHDHDCVVYDQSDSYCERAESHQVQR